MLPMSPVQAYQPDHRYPKIARMPSTGRSLRDTSRANDAATQDRPQMRRLGSLASITQYNPFSRRKSTATISGSSTSNQERSMTAIHSDPAPLATSVSSTEGAKEVIPIPPTVLKSSVNRRSSWIPVPEKATIPLPRSRTLSNLPVPAKRNSRSDAENIPPAGHSPSRAEGIIQKRASRIPTPQDLNISGRSRMSSVPKGILKPSRTLAGLDTKSLPHAPGAKHATKQARPTNFKENFTPTKGPSSDVTSSDNNEESSSEVRKVVKDISNSVDASIAPVERQEGHASQSSPVKKSNGGETRKSYGAQIKQHQLLSPKQPPTPPEALKGVSVVLPSPIKAVPESEVSPGRHTDQEKTPRPKRVDTDIDTVKAAEPVSYWCGRFVSMNDRMRYAEFDSMPMEDNQAMESMADKRRRTMEIFKHLYSKCATDEAKTSLRTFHRYLREMQTRTAVRDEEALVAYIPWGDITGGKDGKDNAKAQRLTREPSVETAASDKSVSTANSLRRSTSAFMDRLLGKSRRTVS
ncbi:hypothetical protein MBLNU457_3983t1 [Dothideomycetes sp. NU457]